MLFVFRLGVYISVCPSGLEQADSSVDTCLSASFLSVCPGR